MVQEEVIFQLRGSKMQYHKQLRKDKIGSENPFIIY